MPSSFLYLLRARITDPAIPILIGLGIILIVAFVVGLPYFLTIAEFLPIIAACILLSFVLIPRKATSLILLALITLSVPFAHFALFVAMNQGFQWTHLFGIIIILHLVVRLLLVNRIRTTAASWWALGILLATFLSTLNFVNATANHTTEFWKSEVQFLFGIALYFAMMQINPKPGQTLLLLKTMIFLSVLVALFGVYQLPARFFGWPGGILTPTNPSLSVGSQAAVLNNLFRASSIFSEPSYFGHYMVAMLALTLPAALNAPRLFGKVSIIWLIIAIQAVGLVLSQSISGFYLLFLLVAIMLFIEKGRGRAKLATGLLLIAAIGAASLFLAQQFTSFPIAQNLIDRSVGIFKYLMGDKSYLVTGESLYMRLSTSMVALRVFFDHPIIGVGLGSYTLVSEQYGEWNPLGFAANTLVNILAETGIIGFIMLIGFSFASLAGLLRFIRRRPSALPEPIGRDNSPTMALVARMAFYLLVVEVLYFHLGGSFFLPATWFYFGLGALVTLQARAFALSIRPDTIASR